MNLTTFSFPTPTLFGAGALSELPPRLRSFGIARPLVVTDAGLLKTSSFENVRDTLGREDEAKTWFVFSGVHSNPIEKDMREALVAFNEHKRDGIIGIGGGSPLDVGKALRLLIMRPDLEFSKFYEHRDWSGLAP